MAKSCHISKAKPERTFGKQHNDIGTDTWPNLLKVISYFNVVFSLT